MRTANTMSPAPSDLSDALPTDRLSERGRPLADLRDELYQLHDVRNTLNVVGAWVQTLGVVLAANAIDHPFVWALAFVLMGRGMVLFAILAHESAHRLLFSDRRTNDFVGTWLVGAPGFVPLVAYRRGHMAHHKEEFGPNEPDMMLYAGYPITRASWRRKLTRDLLGSSGWKNFKPLLLALKSPSARRYAQPIWIVQILLWAVLWVSTGRWWVYPVMWFLPWMTLWRVLNRLRAVAEHGGLQRSRDRRLTTHHVRQGPVARFFMVPYRTGWHLAHHVDIGVPFQNLPRLQRELEACGWVNETMTWPSYRALWAHARSRPNGRPGPLGSVDSTKP